jgi:hypothetical protein
MKVSTSSLISSSVSGSPFCEVCSSTSRKFMCRLLPITKEDYNVFYPSLTSAYVCVCVCVCVCIHVCLCICTCMCMVTTLYSPVVTICTTSLTYNTSTFCPHSVFTCFALIWEPTAIISLYNIK